MASPGNSLGFQPGFLHFSLGIGLGLSYWNGEERRINIATNGAKQGFKGRYGGLYGAKLLKAKGDGCSLRLSPVLRGLPHPLDHAQGRLFAIFEGWERCTRRLSAPTA